MEERNRQLEKRVDEIARLVKQNNQMLKRGRTFQAIKTFIIVAILIGGSSYGYYVYSQYRDKIIEFQEKVDQLHHQAESALEAGAKLKETIGSIPEIFDSVEEIE